MITNFDVSMVTLFITITTIIIISHYYIFVASIYLKNTVNKYWKARDSDEGETEQLYTIQEESKHVLRQNVIEGIIQTPPLIRYYYI